MSQKKIRFIINPKSGAMHKEHFVDWIQSGIDPARYVPEIIYTEYPKHATELSREAALRGDALVVTVGGDGSVNEAGAGLVGSNTALGIIPTGSGNGMARHLNIPVDFKKAMHVINRGKPERIDTATVNSRFCAGTFGMGFDAHIAHLFAEAGTRGYSTYVKLVLTEFYKYPSRKFNLEIDGDNFEADCFLLTIANSSQFGNNAVIAPFADVKDGWLDISMMKKFPFLMAPHLIYRMMNNSLHRSRYFSGKRGKSIRILNSGKLKGHIDGEPVVLQDTIEVKVVPLSLDVWVLPKEL